MNAREEKGKMLAAGAKFVLGSIWAVPSQSHNAGGYVVNTLQGSCTCPDYEERRGKCKHQWAVEFAKTVVVAPDGSSVTTETVKISRKTYKQDWPNYTAAQCAEKEIYFAAADASGSVSARCPSCAREGPFAWKPSATVPS